MGACLEVDLRGNLVVAFPVGILKEEVLLGTLVEPFLVDSPTFLEVGLLDIREVAFLVDTLAFPEEGLLGILPSSTC